MEHPKWGQKFKIHTAEWDSFRKSGLHLFSSALIITKNCLVICFNILCNFPTQQIRLVKTKSNCDFLATNVSVKVMILSNVILKGMSNEIKDIKVSYF